MKIYLIAFNFLIFSLSYAVSVCIDPGHGGDDPGAIGSFMYEKAANLQVSLSIRNNLNFVPAITVGLTRDTDITLSLAQRCEYANSRGYDRFMCVHHNAFDGTVQGTESFRHITDAIDSPSGLFQQAIHPWLIWAFNYRDRGMKQEDFYVLRNTSMPAILAEASFIDYNGDFNESERFSSNWNDHIGRESYAYARGFCDLFGIYFPDYGTPIGIDSIVIDDGDPQWSSVGSWAISSSGGYLDDYRWTSTTYQGDYCLYTPNIPYRANWNVYIWYRQGTNRSDNVTVEIAHSDGNNSVNINQQENGGQWVYLGTYGFNIGTAGYVRISDNGSPSGMVVVADAVKFVYDSPLAVEEKIATKPISFELGQNYPNPFNLFTNIPFTLYESKTIEFSIYNVMGQKISSISGPSYFGIGSHTILWNGKSSEGNELPSGIYLGNMKVGDEIKTIKMILKK